jgi:hypothetical protein
MLCHLSHNITCSDWMNIPEVVHTVHPFPLKLFGFWTFFNTCLMFQWKICTSKKLDFQFLVIVFILANEWYCFPKMFIVYKLVRAKQIWSNPLGQILCNVSSIQYWCPILSFIPMNSDFEHDAVVFRQKIWIFLS